MGNEINWCPAVSYGAFGMGNARCALQSGHDGRHFDMKGRGWFNESDPGSDLDIFEAQDDIDRRWE
jgi:hypothetical protein